MEFRVSLLLPSLDDARISSRRAYAINQQLLDPSVDPAMCRNRLLIGGAGNNCLVRLQKVSEPDISIPMPSSATAIFKLEVP
jgi:hypothetical protein